MVSNHPNQQLRRSFVSARRKRVAGPRVRWGSVGQGLKDQQHPLSIDLLRGPWLGDPGDHAQAGAWGMQPEDVYSRVCPSCTSGRISLTLEKAGFS